MPGILNHCEYAIRTGPLEGANNKSKVKKRKGYGFQDPDYFTRKVKQAPVLSLRWNPRRRRRARGDTDLPRPALQSKGTP